MYSCFIIILINKREALYLYFRYTDVIDIPYKNVWLLTIVKK